MSFFITPDFCEKLKLNSNEKFFLAFEPHTWEKDKLPDQNLILQGEKEGKLIFLFVWIRVGNTKRWEK